MDQKISVKRNFIGRGSHQWRPIHPNLLGGFFVNKIVTATGAIIVTISLLAPTAQAVGKVISPAVPATSGTRIERVVKGDYKPLSEMFYFESAKAPVANELKFPDVAPNHWAGSTILSGVQKGYIAGYPDGTFQPNRNVSRSEFIKMVVAATNIPTAEVGSPWYKPYTDAAIEYGYIDQNEYDDGNYVKDMTRLEMAKVAVRAAGLSANSDAEYLLVATKNGLIAGVGNGDLAPELTTTRAQSVTIVERVLTLRSGGKLPVDEAAVKAAEQLLNQKYDAWGRAIRTTNLPKNYKDFPYILKDVPNEAYEMEFYYTAKSGLIKPVEMANKPLYRKEDIDIMVERLTTYYDYVLNMDYRTIDSKWVDGVISQLRIEGVNQYTKDKIRKAAESQVQYVKDNKIITKGFVRPEPSMMYNGFAGNYIRTYFEFTIIQAEDGAFSQPKDGTRSIFFAQGGDLAYDKSFVGKTVKGYADLVIGTMSGGGFDSHGPVTTTNIGRNNLLLK
jgi:hypothetical protein